MFTILNLGIKVEAQFSKIIIGRLKFHDYKTFQDKPAANTTDRLNNQLASQPFFLLTWNIQFVIGDYLKLNIIWTGLSEAGRSLNIHEIFGEKSLSGQVLATIFRKWNVIAEFLALCNADNGQF